MKIWRQFVTVGALVLGAGCGNSHVTVKPDNATMVGTWTPDKASSTCPSGLISETTKLVIRQDGTFLAQDFPREVSLGRQSRVDGKWSLKNEDNRWSLDLPWETPAMSMLDGARLITKNKEVLIEFWIGDPDAYSRLVLRKQANP